MGVPAKIASSLYDHKGQRKYLSPDERRLFLQAAEKEERSVYVFIWLLHETGCRVSEALALRSEHIDLADKSVIFETLKQRRKGVFRAVPVSVRLVVALRSQASFDDPEALVWHWSRMTAYRHVKRVMKRAGIYGTKACPKGLRHGFAVAAIQQRIPLNLVQRWLGHAQMNTTAIYANAIGNEEREIAERMWE